LPEYIPCTMGIYDVSSFSSPFIMRASTHTTKQSASYLSIFGKEIASDLLQFKPHP